MKEEVKDEDSKNTKLEEERPDEEKEKHACQLENMRVSLVLMVQTDDCISKKCECQRENLLVILLLVVQIVTVRRKE